MNKAHLLNGVAAFSLLFATGCSSIVSKSNWPVTFNSNPSGAEITITDKKGKEVHRGTTPTTLTLSSKSGYFKSAKYDVKIKMAGYATGKGTVSAKVNGWYFGNFVFGGLIGFLIVDPATGAMWRLPEDYAMDLTKETAGLSKNPTLQIVTLDQVPAELQSRLVRIN